MNERKNTIPIEKRPLKSFPDWKVTDLPVIYPDELSESDYIMISHYLKDDGVEKRFSSHKIKINDLIEYLKKKC